MWDWGPLLQLIAPLLPACHERMGQLVWLDNHVPNCADPGEVYWKKHHPGTAHRGIMEEGGIQGCITESSQPGNILRGQ